MMLDDHTVPDRDFKCSMSMRIDAANLAGQSSGTSTAHKGFKPKVFTVTLTIAYIDAHLLGELIAIAEAKNKDGGLRVYNITDELANSVKVRRVQFAEEFHVREKEQLQAWTIQFTLQDYQSVPEKVEQRQALSNAPAQTADGAVSGDEGGEAESGEMGMFERMLAKMDKALS